MSGDIGRRGRNVPESQRRDDRRFALAPAATAECAGRAPIMNCRVGCMLLNRHDFQTRGRKSERNPSGPRFPLQHLLFPPSRRDNLSSPSGELPHGAPVREALYTLQRTLSVMPALTHEQAPSRKVRARLAAPCSSHVLSRFLRASRLSQEFAARFMAIGQHAFSSVSDNTPCSSRTFPRCVTQLTSV